MTPFTIAAWAALVLWFHLDTWGSVMLPVAAGVTAAWFTGYLPAPLVPTTVAALVIVRTVLWAWDIVRG